jgi:hypothetical protein
MSTGAIAGAAAARARAERERKEEEEMTPYSPQDLAEGWEFKILRGNFHGRLQAILEEEKQGGWVLVEKFDDQRIRLKRPAGSKVVEGDFANGYDPYRTQLPPSTAAVKAVLLIFGVALVSGLLMMLLLLINR